MRWHRWATRAARRARGARIEVAPELRSSARKARGLDQEKSREKAIFFHQIPKNFGIVSQAHVRLSFYSLSAKGLKSCAFMRTGGAGGKTGLLLATMFASLIVGSASYTPALATPSVDFLPPKIAGDAHAAAAAAAQVQLAATAEDRSLLLEMGLRFFEELATAPEPGNATLEQTPELRPWLAAVRPLAAGLLPLLVSAGGYGREAQPLGNQQAAAEPERTPHPFVLLLLDRGDTVLGRHEAAAHFPGGGAAREAAGADKELEMQEAGMPQDEEPQPRPAELQNKDGEDEQRVQLNEGEQLDVDRGGAGGAAWRREAGEGRGGGGRRTGRGR
eukprot:SAG22_NODE_523_length_9482_cov_4.992548_11_plen_332_part_00